MEVDDCASHEFELDQACVIFDNENSVSNLRLYGRASDCILCPLKRIAHLGITKNNSIIFNSQKTWLWRIFDSTHFPDFKSSTDESDLMCEVKPKLGEYGVYQLLINDECKLNLIKPSSNSYMPFIITVSVLIGIVSLISLGKKISNRWGQKLLTRSDMKVVEQSTKKRVQSIDTVRGMIILMMIYVNNGAGGYDILEHAVWNGLFIGDLVFPCFIWIMGFCIPIALTSQLSRGVAKTNLCINIAKRSCILFFIGVCLNTLGTNSQLENIRVFGVLQRFGVAYLFVGLSYVLLNQRETTVFQYGCLANFNDFVSLAPQWIFMITLLIAHCIMTFCLKVPGCPTGYLGPGGLHQNGKYFNCTGGSAGYIDRVVLSIDHIYQNPSINTIYQSGPFEPEGILGCLTTIIQTFFGVQAGKILRVYKDWRSRIMRWLILAAVYAVIGVILHFCNLIPVNKNLWSISFVLITTSFALALFTACYLLVDIVQLWNGGPFRIPGMNSLIIYVGHQMCYQIFPFHWKYGTMNTHTWRTIAALWDASLWAVIAYILHHKRIYITI